MYLHIRHQLVQETHVNMLRTPHIVPDCKEAWHSCCRNVTLEEACSFSSCGVQWPLQPFELALPGTMPYFCEPVPLKAFKLSSLAIRGEVSAAGSRPCENCLYSSRRLLLLWGPDVVKEVVRHCLCHAWYFVVSSEHEQAYTCFFACSAHAHLAPLQKNGRDNTLF